MLRHPLKSYRWNGNEWSADTTITNIDRSSPSSLTIRLATLNILADCFPWFIRLAIRSDERYQWLCKHLTLLRPTIIGLNEVTNNALRQLEQSTFVRENYFITEISTNTIDSCLSPHGCVILSQLPLIDVFALKVTGTSREAIIAKVEWNSQPFYVCSHHTTAYQTAKNAQLRYQQIRDIIDNFTSDHLPFVIMGDLNLHYQFENNVVLDHHLIDAWAQTHFSDRQRFNDGDLGYTFDAQKNTFIPYYIPGEQRRMRLDRILFSSGFPASTKTPCHLWANEPIRSNFYLFPSDHFGLYIDIEFDTTNTTDMLLSQPDPTAQAILADHIRANEDRRSYRLPLIRTATAMTSQAVWLAAVSLGFK